MPDLEFRVSELERRLANLLRHGTVEALDESSARVKVRCGEILTGWLPFYTRRAGEDRSWWAPEPGEQVTVLSPSGEMAQGSVLPALYRDAHPAPADSKDVCRIEFKAGGFAQYDRESGALTVSAEGLVRLIGKGKVEIVGADGAQVRGTVQGHSLCMLTGKPHAHISATVKESP